MGKFVIMLVYHIIIEILQSEGLKPQIETQTFKDQSWQVLTCNFEGYSHYIFEEDIAINGDDIAWFQSNEEDQHLLRIIQDGHKTEWIPKTYNPIFGCECLLLEWFEGHLLFIYREKHGIYVCAIKDRQINDFYIHGEELAKKGNKLSYETYQNKLENHVRVIELPSLKELEPITKEAAKKLGLLPQDLHRTDVF